MEENNSLIGQIYDLPEDRDEFIDIKSGEIVKQETVDPMDVIRKIAEKIGTKIQDPNPKCKKPGCYGRGWIGRDATNHAPIPCVCIYPKLSGDEALQSQVVQEGLRPLTRVQRRRLEVHSKKQKAKKNKREWQKKHKKK